MLLSALGLLLLQASQASDSAADVDRVAASLAVRFGHSRQMEYDPAHPILKGVRTHELVGALIDVAEGRSRSASTYVAGGGEAEAITIGAMVALAKVQAREPDHRIPPYLRGVCVEKSRPFEVRRESSYLLSRIHHSGLQAFYVEVLRDHPELASAVISSLDSAAKARKPFAPVHQIYTPEVRTALHGYFSRYEGRNGLDKRGTDYNSELLRRLDRAAGYQDALPVPAVGLPTPPPDPHAPSVRTTAAQEGTPGATRPSSSSSIRLLAAVAVGAVVLLAALLLVRRRAFQGSR